METWPRWARIGVAVVALVLLCWLLIWLFSAFLMVLVKGVVGLFVVIGMVVLARTAVAGRGPRDPLE
ncbi:hypothetical protein [Embleya hyalina]|uniref:Uncharacterized protein n=1 Tax=Embleya hyalina TaxID=516124 RepID=A0A401YUW2_9ACTN|nr:hypothetical protein [Embleya hyalina]GCD98402.1 hypothetical protein EHYA_06109 [Embleya hyalina]